MTAQLILQAANILDTSEYEVFRAAHMAWFGSMPTTAELQPVYDRHFRDGITPPWVRYYAAQVVRQFAAREAKRTRFSILGYLLRPRQREEGPRLEA